MRLAFGDIGSGGPADGLPGVRVRSPHRDHSQHHLALQILHANQAAALERYPIQLSASRCGEYGGSGSRTAGEQNELRHRVVDVGVLTLRRVGVRRVGVARVGTSVCCWHLRLHYEELDGFGGKEAMRWCVVREPHFLARTQPQRPQHPARYDRRVISKLRLRRCAARDGIAEEEVGLEGADGEAVHCCGRKPQIVQTLSLRIRSEHRD